MNRKLKTGNTFAIIAISILAAHAEAAAGAGASGNVLLEEWTGPHGGVPAFDAMDLEHVKPALEAGMAMHLAELDQIAQNPESPGFENTILAMERAGRDLDRVMVYWGIWRANLASPQFRAIQSEMVPKLSDYRSQITQNAALFARIKAVYEGDEMDSLRPDQHRLVLLAADAMLAAMEPEALVAPEVGSGFAGLFAHATIAARVQSLGERHVVDAHAFGERYRRRADT